MSPDGLGSWPARRARSTPDAVALVHDGRRLTYRELHARVDALADGLHRELGVERGDRVAYLGPNHPSFLETLFAVTGLGAVFVPLNTRLAAAELAFMLEDSGADRLVHAVSHVGVVEQVVRDRPTVVATVVGGEHSAYEDLIARHLGAGTGTDATTSLEDDAVVMYTSGTTGRPKGARLTHGNLTWNAVNVVVDIDIASDEVTLVSAPLFHTAALGMTTLPTLLKGGAVLLEPSFDPERTLDLIERERVTFAFGVPTMFDAVARSPRWGGADLSSLRYLLCGGAPVPADLIDRYGERGLTFMQGYGMTEAAPHVLLLPASASRARAGSAGRPAFFTDVALDAVQDAGGGRGELLVRGPNVVSGYWNGVGAEAFDDGWFRSGDIAERDAEGWYHIIDRAKDMFISGGENVYPAEVEDVLRRHHDIVDAAVIGVADPTWGEVGHALVVRAQGSALDADAVTTHAGERLGRYKIPRRVTFVEALPRNPTGKLDKVALRREHAGRETPC